MEVASIVAKTSSAALGLVASQMGTDAVLLGARSHARGVELTAASARVAPAITRFTAQARRLGFAEDSYAPLLRTIADPVSAADLWVRFVAGIERRLGIGAPPAGGVALLLAGPLAGTSDIAARIAVTRGVKAVQIGLVQPVPKSIARDAVLFIATDDIAAARHAMRQVPDVGTLVLLPADRSADDWAVTFSSCDGAVIVEDLERPGAMLSVLLGSGLALAAIIGPDGISAARVSKVCRAIVVALGRIGSGGRSGERA